MKSTYFKDTRMASLQAMPSLLSFLLLLALFVGKASAQQIQSKQPEEVQLPAEQEKDFKKEAKKFFQTTNFKAALEAYRLLYKLNPDNVEYNYMLGLSYLNTNIDKSKAYSLIEFAINNTKDIPTKENYYQLSRKWKINPQRTIKGCSSYNPKYGSQAEAV